MEATQAHLATVENLLYRPTQVEGAVIWMLDDASWILHKGSQYWAVDRKHHVHITATTTIDAAREALR